jgi:hypothetical protein
MVTSTPKGGEVVSAQQAAALEGLVRAAREVASSRGALLQLRAHLKAKQSVLEDLCFQIEQLKGRLGTLNAASTMDKDATHGETSRLEARLQSRLESIIPHAERIMSHFSSYPELRQQLAPHLPEG